ncbi:MAG: SDR family oxidoreductase [Candidatus Aureabacteria bacterium]|nr:SDR family oxidoreductase [Candidatus Auribacterota bacterium]
MKTNDNFSNKPPILIIGATSGIAHAFSLEAAKKGHPLILAGRDLKKIQLTATDLEIRTDANIMACLSFDALKHEDHFTFMTKVLQHAPELEGCFVACGVMFDQKQCESDFSLTLETITCNYLGMVSILNLLANHFEKKKKGFISCVTSVAGDRGRQSNYIYGSSKAAMNAYLEGLRNRLFSSHVLVQTVKAGPTDTPMTKGMKNLPFLAPPETLAKDIWKAILQKKDIVYTPRIWQYLMLIINHIPEWFFKRMKL